MMPKSAFTIDKVTIEGFKVFRDRQTFDVKGRHVFLFGPNGHGKTSFVEAIRWCLFGLASRGGETVKNQFYAGPCTVQLGLRGPNGIWTLQRTLGTERSPLVVRDPSGHRQDVEDVFPQLSRIGPSEGTHVIYAAQQPSSRRPEADITDFSYVVYRYLGLEDVPRLLATLKQLMQNWETAENEILHEHDELGEQISDRLTDVQDRLTRITEEPPWGDEITPVLETTRSRVNDLMNEAHAMGALTNLEGLLEVSEDEKLDRAESAVSEALSGEETPLQERLRDSTDRLHGLQQMDTEIKATEQALTTTMDEIGAIDRQLDESLADMTIEAGEHRLEDISTALDQAQHLGTIVDSASRYLDGVDDVSFECPVCGSDHEIDAVKVSLALRKQEIDPATRALIDEREQLSEAINKASALAARKRIAVEESQLREKNLSQLFESARADFNTPELVNRNALEELTRKCEASVAGIQRALTSREETRTRWSNRISRLRRELSFHRLRHLQGRLRHLHDERYEGLRGDASELGKFRDAVGQIVASLTEKLKQALDQVLPPVAAQMTEVYMRLTEQPVFDSVTILHHPDAQDATPELELRVTSSRGAGIWSTRDGVLNGQALNALQLVPYFVFSRYQEEPLLDLLLLDDPTQAFDTRRIELLLKELSDATAHAHLLVATHEEERFLPTLLDHFSVNQVFVLRTNAPDDKGPHFEDISKSLRRSRTSTRASRRSKPQ